MSGQNADFNGIARHYRLLEYLSLGPLLERMRFQFLRSLAGAERALVLGDGDGRFVEQLLRTNSRVQVTAVDASAEMLRILVERCAPLRSRLRTVHEEALAFFERGETTSFDLVATHFFLDCLTQAEANKLIALAASQLNSGGRWVLSEFRIPAGTLHLPARAMVRGLYVAFRVLTGLQTTELPDYETALSGAGLERMEQKFILGGILTAELWQKPSRPARP